MGTKANNCELPQLPSADVQAVRQRDQRPERKANAPTVRPRLCWTRQELVAATGLSYRTIRNLELRGLLRRCPVGVNVAVYSAESVTALFQRGGQEDTGRAKCPASEPEQRGDYRGFNGHTNDATNL
jgi:hypothetical protein